MVLTAAPGLAQAPPAAILGPDDKADVVRIERYINAVTTVEARFLQISSTGETAKGMVYLSRPGRLRIEYDPPVPVLIVANGTWLMYQDTKLDQISHVLLKSTPASILVEENVSFLGDRLSVTRFERAPGVLRLTVAHTADLGEGTITLVFSDRPLALRKWIVNDAQGVETTVSLLGPRFGGPLADDLFRLVSQPPAEPSR